MTNKICNILKIKNKETIMKKQTLKIKPSQIKKRVTWGFNPISRVKPSKKIYSRKKFRIDKI